MSCSTVFTSMSEIHRAFKRQRKIAKEKLEEGSIVNLDININV